jgi:hypothetical protein
VAVAPETQLARKALMVSMQILQTRIYCMAALEKIAVLD